MTRDEEIRIEHECAKLVARYANLNDVADFEAVTALFAEDGRLARPSAPDQWIEGRGDILAAFRARAPRRTRHLCTNVVIDVIAPSQARGETAIALFLSDTEVRVGSFVDRFRLTGDGWRFAERRGTMTF